MGGAETDKIEDRLSTMSVALITTSDSHHHLIMGDGKMITLFR
jgi:hypothetical protein